MSDVIDQYADHVSRYEFPYINTKYEYRCLTVERRGRAGEDSWAIMNGERCYQPRGRRWAYERRPSSRTDKFLAASRMPLVEALPLAEKLARQAKKKWDARLARMIARQEAAEKAKEAKGE